MKLPVNVAAIDSSSSLSIIALDNKMTAQPSALDRSCA